MTDAPAPSGDPPAASAMTRPDARSEVLTQFGGADLHDLADAAEAAILDGGGFGWLTPPPREVMERFWNGVLVMPRRHLVVGRLDGVIAGSAQLIQPPENNEAQAFSATVTTAFVAPWARGYGLAAGIMLTVEKLAVSLGVEVLNLDVRETQIQAIRLYETLGYRRWGTNPFYARVDGAMIAGHAYTKLLTDPAGHAADGP